MSSFLENNPGGYTSDYRDLFSAVNKFEQMSILEQVSSYLWDFNKNLSIGNSDINIQSLSGILLTLLDPGFDPSPSKPSVDPRSFHDLNLMANAASDNRPTDLRALSVWYIHTHYNQIILNPNSPYYKTVLFILLFCNNQDISSTTLHGYFFELFGMTGERFGTALWVIFAFFQDHHHLKNLEHCGLKNIEDLRRVLQVFASSMQQIRRAFSSERKYQGTPWNARFNPFRDFPIVVEQVDGEEHYRVPAPQFLHMLHTDNVYYHLFSHFLEKEKRLNPNGKDAGKNPFARDFGKAIEDLVFQFARHELGEKRVVLPEFPFRTRRGSEAKAADLHLIENKAENLCMVQVKGKRVRLSSQGGNLDTYLSDINDSLVYGVRQNFSLLAEKAFLDGLEERTKWKRNLAKVTFLIVYVEGFYDISLPEIRSHIDAEIAKAKISAAITLDIPIAFVSLEHFLRLVEWSRATGRSISDKIRDYVKYLRNPEKENNLGSPGFAHTFDEYIRIKTRNQEYPKSLSKRVYDRYIEYVKEAIDASRSSQ